MIRSHSTLVMERLRKVWYSASKTQLLKFPIQYTLFELQDGGLILRLKDGSLLNMFRQLAPYYKCLWSGRSWFCLWFSCVLASDQHWVLCFASSKWFWYKMFLICFTMMFYWWCRNAPMLTKHIFVIWSCIRIHVRVRLCCISFRVSFCSCIFQSF